MLCLRIQMPGHYRAGRNKRSALRHSQPILRNDATAHIKRFHIRGNRLFRVRALA